MAYSHASNVDSTTAGGPVTVPAGKRVLSYHALSTAGGTLVITPADGVEQDPIIIPANGGINYSFAPMLNVQGANLEAGSTLVFTGTTSYWVVFV